MPINEYDEALTTGSPLGNNLYDDQTKNQNEDQDNPYLKEAVNLRQNNISNLKQSMFVGTQSQPDRAAKVTELANKLKVNPDFVERNYDQLLRKDQIENQDYNHLIDDNPKTSSWLSDPKNSSLSHDDIDGLTGIENQVQKYSRLEASGRSLMSGFASTFKSLAQIPSTITELSLLPVNYATSFLGPEAQIKSPEWLRNNFATEYWQNQVEAWAPPQQLEGFSETFSKASRAIDRGDYSSASGILFDSFSQKLLSNLPLMASMAAPALLGEAAPGLAFGGLAQSGQNIEEGYAKGIKPLNVQTNAAVQGLAEIAFERMGTIGFLENWSTKIAQNYGKPVAAEILKDFAKTMFAAPFIEATEEGATQAVQSLSDYALRINPDGLKTFVADVAGASILGGMSGAAFTGPTAILAGRTRIQELKQANRSKDFYLSFGSSSEAAKLRERLPEAHREFVDNIVKDSPVENIYISPESFETYFQSKDINPVKMVQELGLISEYEQAKELGRDMKVPLSTWATELVPTEHYAALADNIKFRPEDLSVNESKILYQETQDQIAMEAAQKSDQNTQDQTARIKEIVKQQLIEAGVPLTQAEQVSLLNSQFYKTIAQRLNIQPEQLFKERGVSISNPELAPISKEPLQILEQNNDGGNKPLGQIVIGKDRSLNIQLFNSKNASTPVHELAHAYLEILHDKSVESESIKQDLQIIRDWVGAKKDKPLTRDQHEQFARGFESYLMEGKAPSSVLRKAFAAFKVWLTHIYRMIQNLKVQVSPEVKSVFDRMLAAEDEIASAEIEQNQNPLFIDPIEWGMSETQAAKYIEARQAARDASESALQHKLVQDLNRIKSKEYKEKYAELKTIADFEISQDPVYQAIDLLKAKEPIEGVEPIKLLKESVVETFGAEFIKQLPKGIFSKEGMHFDLAASMLGFSSGQDMLNKIAAAPSKSVAIESLVSARIEQDFPQLLGSAEIGQEAMQAIHNDKRAQLLRMELEHLASHNLPVLKEAIRKISRRVPTDLQIRTSAESIINSKNISEISPYEFQLAEARNAKKAGVLLAQGDIDSAFEAKRKELLNHELFRAATAARDLIEKGLDSFQKIASSDESIASSRDINLVNTARAILSNYGIGKFDEQRPLDYLEKIKNYGEEDSYQNLLSLFNNFASTPKNFNELTFQEFSDLKNAIDAIWSYSRSARTMELDGKRIESQLVKDAIAKELASFPAAKKKAFETSKNDWEMSKNNWMNLVSWLRRSEHLLDAIGPNAKKLFYIINDAALKYRKQKNIDNVEIEKVFEPILKGIKESKIDAPELIGKDGRPYQFQSLFELMGLLPHLGNLSNHLKLVNGMGWSVDGLNRFLNRMYSEKILRKEHFDAIQKVWDLLESRKPEIQKAHKDLYGYYFDEVTADSFTTPFGVYRGGYYPIRYDKYASTAALKNSEIEELQNLTGIDAFPSTGKGSTMKRLDSYSAPIDMDIRLLTKHLDWVARFSHLEPRVREVARLFSDRKFVAEFDQFDPTLVRGVFMPWLKRSAAQITEMPMSDPGWRSMANVAREIRKRSTNAIMFANVGVALQNYSNFVPAMAIVSPRYLRDASWEFMRSSKDLANSISEKSEYMNDRLKNQTYEIQQEVNDLLLNTSKYKQVVEYANKVGNYLNKATNNHVDLITWQAAYNQFSDKGLSEKEAIQEADSVVRRVNGSNNPESISSVEAQNAFAKLFLTFYSFFNNMANLAGSEVFTKNFRRVGIRKGMGRAAYVILMTMMIGPAAAQLVTKLMSGKFDEDDDNEYMDDFLQVFLGGPFNNLASMTPFVGHLVRKLDPTNKRNYANDNILNSPGIKALEDSTFGVYQDLTGDHDVATKKQVKDYLTLISLLTGAPLAPLARPIGYMSDVDEGKARPSNPIDFARGLITGRK